MPKQEFIGQSPRPSGHWGPSGPWSWPGGAVMALSRGLEPPSSQIPLPRVCSGWEQGPGAASRSWRKASWNWGPCPIRGIITHSQRGPAPKWGRLLEIPLLLHSQGVQTKLVLLFPLRVEDKISPLGGFSPASGSSQSGSSSTRDVWELWGHRPRHLLAAIWGVRAHGCCGISGGAEHGTHSGTLSSSPGTSPSQRSKKKKGFEAARPRNPHGGMQQLPGKLLLEVEKPERRCQAPTPARADSPSPPRTTGAGFSLLPRHPGPVLSAGRPLRRSRCRTPRAPAA